MNTAGTPKAIKPKPEGKEKVSSAPSVDVIVQGKLGQKLRESYQQVVSEPIPPRFLALLDTLKQKQTVNSEDGEGGA